MKGDIMSSKAHFTQIIVGMFVLYALYDIGSTRILDLPYEGIEIQFDVDSNDGDNGKKVDLQNSQGDLQTISKRSVDEATCYQKKTCPPFWTHFRDNCYRFIGTSNTWVEAETHCNEYFTDTSQGHLVSIHSKEESDFVFKVWHDSVIQSSQLAWSLDTDARFSPLTSIFLGLHDSEQEGVFVWTDGSPNDYNEWGLNQPSDSGGEEDCTRWIDPSEDVTYKPWNDIRCHDPTLLPYVCKLSITV